MATDYFSGLLDDEEKKKQDAGVLSQAPQGGQESAIVQGAPEPNQPGQGTKSGSFTNLQSYLDANESSKFGKQLAGQVEGEADQASGVQSNAENQFKQRADSSAVGLNEGIISRLNSDPVSLAKDAAAKSEFVKMRDANYGGPKNFSDANDLYSQTNQSTEKANQAAKLANDESGRKTLLDSYYGSGAGKYDYTSGQKKLDNYLVQVDPNSREYFKAAQDKADALTNNFSNLTNSLNQYGTQKAQETAQARQTARGALGLGEDNSITASSPIMGILNTAKSRAESLNAQKSDDYNKALAGLRSRDVATGSKYGIAQDRGLFNADLSQYLSQANNIDYNRAATKEEQARLDALTQLAGVDNTYLPNADLAGNYDLTNTFNSGGLDSYINGKRGELDIRKADFDSRKNELQKQIEATYQNELPKLFEGRDDVFPQEIRDILNNRVRDLDSQYEQEKKNAGFYDTLNKLLSVNDSPGGVWGRGRFEGGR